MGAADAVPGVSGGTIAFITGIYEELIFSLKQCSVSALKVLFQSGIKATWQHINGGFLLALFGGIIISILTISRVVIYLLDNHPILLWSFFFGLILAAVWSVIRHIEKWEIGVIATFLIGAVGAFIITTISPTTIETSPFIVFFSGMIAICAMILPGISGSFILLLLGMYAPMLIAVKELQIATLCIFASGCVVGLLSFSHVLSWMFKHYKTMTLALLGGFMLGSLNKVWPWKQTIESVIDRHGKEIPLVENNILPHTFETINTQPDNMWYAIMLMILGMVMVIALEKIGHKSADH
ncbi:MAG: putative membrane protein [Paraglaciecola sp.]|jgi:putative membrane protein